MTTIRPDINKSALIVVDMQNDFLHPDGIMGQLAKEYPGIKIDLKFLESTIGNIVRLVKAFRKAKKPIVYVVHMLKTDYSDAAFPYWKFPVLKEKQFIVEGTWGAQIVDELKPRNNEHLVVKKGFGGFSNTSLDTILRNQSVNTCVVVGVTTCLCVSTTVRGGVEHNYRMIVVSDATAEIHREAHEAELKILARAFAEVMTTHKVVEILKEIK